jgi:hypothetical protein
MKITFKLSASDIVDLYDLLQKSIETIAHNDMKEINYYRLDYMMKLNVRFHNRISLLQVGRPSKMSFSMPEVLALRYCLLHRRATAGMNALFMKIDSKVHPNIYERKEVTNG